MAKPTPLTGKLGNNEEHGGLILGEMQNLYSSSELEKKKITSTCHYLTVQSAWGEVLPSGGTDLEDTVLQALGEEAQLQSTNTEQFGLNF